MTGRNLDIESSIANEATPVESPQDPFEMLSKKIDDVGADTKLAVSLAREANNTAVKTYNIALHLNARSDRQDKRLLVIEAYHLWLPLVAIVIATLALVRTW